MASSGAGLRIRQKSTVTQYVNHTRGETENFEKTGRNKRSVEIIAVFKAFAVFDMFPLHFQYSRRFEAWMT